MLGLGALGGRRRSRPRAPDLVGRRSEPQSRDQRARPQSPRRARARSPPTSPCSCSASPASPRSPPPAFWGWRLLTERRLEHPRLKIGLYLVGIAATLRRWPRSCPRPEAGRCRPALAASSATRCSRCRAGCSPARPGGWPLSARVFAALAILALAAAAGFGFAHARTPTTRRRARPKAARSQAQARFDDEEADDEPGFGMVSIGAVIHALLCRQGRAAPARPPPPEIRAGDAARRPAAAVAGRARAPWLDAAPRRRRADQACGLRARGEGGTARRPPARVRCASRRPPVPLKRGRAGVQAQLRLHAARRLGHAAARHAGRAEEIGRDARSRTTRSSRTRACSKACSTISASRARSSTCAPARS